MAREYAAIEIGTGYSTKTLAQSYLTDWKENNVDENNGVTIGERTGTLVDALIFIVGNLWIIVVVLMFLI